MPAWTDEDLARAVRNLWYARSEVQYETRLWLVGKTIDHVTGDWRVSRRDAALREVAKATREPPWLAFEDLAEAFVVARRFPKLPPLPWPYLVHLAAVENDAARERYVYEAACRMWTEAELVANVRRGSLASTALLEPTRIAPMTLVAGDDRAAFTIREVSNGAVVEELDPRGASSTFATLESMPTCSVVLGGQLYVFLADGMYRVRRGSSVRVVTSNTAAVASVLVGAHVVTAWCTPSSTTTIVSIADGSSASAAKVRGRVVSMTAGAGCAFLALSEPSEIIELAIPTGTIVRHIPLQTPGSHAPLLPRGSQLMFTDAVGVVKHERIMSPRQARRGRVHAVRVVEPDRMVVCVNSSGQRRDWRVGRVPLNEVNVLPDGRGVIITAYKSAIALTRWESRPRVLARFAQDVIGAPVLVRTKICWLNSGVLDGPPSLEIFDYTTGAWSYVRLALRDARALHAFGDTLAVETSAGSALFAIDGVIAAAIENRDRQGAPLEPSDDAGLIGGIALAGSQTESWTIAPDKELASRLLPSESLARWLEPTGTSRDRVWNQAVDAAIDDATTWPDARKQLADACPPAWFALAQPLEHETWKSPAFGSPPATLDDVKPILELKRQHETSLASPVDATRTAILLLYAHIRRCQTGMPLDDVAQRAPSRRVDATAEARQALGWLNLDRIYETARRDRVTLAMSKLVDVLKWPALATGVFWLSLYVIGGDAKMLGAKPWAGLAFAIAGGGWLLTWIAFFAVVRTMKRAQSTWNLDSVAQRWPEGCPPLLREAKQTIRFVQDCVASNLLAPSNRSRLAVALSRAWSHPAVHRGAMVFISYSGKQADVAQRLARALDERGVKAVLDRHEIQLGDPDADVELWIAESMMRCSAVIHLVSNDVRHSGWVNRESEWYCRLLAVKPRLVLPYLVMVGEQGPDRDYPLGRVVPPGHLLERWDETVNELAVRIVLDWLLDMKATQTGFGVAYRADVTYPIKIFAKPKRTTTALD